MEHIAVVDDESALRSNLSYALVKAGYRVSAYANGQKAWDGYEFEAPDIYVLDILMPRMDGLEFCRRLRKVNTLIPIIFLSSRDEELDRIIGLETGGDDYIGKPFSVRELIARIQAVLRRTSGKENTEGVSIQKGPLSMNPANYGAEWDGTKLILTVSEYRLLLNLANNPGVVRSRSDLYNIAFPEDHYVNERAVDSHIKRIRRKLEQAGAPKNTLETIYGVGYKLGIDEWGV